MPDPIELKRRGRPFVTDEDRRSVTFTFRGKPKLKRDLEELSQKTGRTISQEIERLLEFALDPKGETESLVKNLISDIGDNYEEKIIANISKSTDELIAAKGQELKQIGRAMISEVEAKIEELKKLQKLEG